MDAGWDTGRVHSHISRWLGALQSTAIAQVCLVSSARKIGSPHDLSAQLLEEFGLTHLDFPLFGEQPHEGGERGRSCFNYMQLKHEMSKSWHVDQHTFIAVGTTVARVFPQLTGVPVHAALKLPHYCMWHRLPAEDVAVAVGPVLRLVQQDSASIEARIRRVASEHAAEIVTDDFRFYFRHNVRSATHQENQLKAVSNPSAETRAAQPRGAQERGCV